MSSALISIYLQKQFSLRFVYFLCLLQKTLLKPTCVITQQVEWAEQYPSVVRALWRKTSRSLCVPFCHRLRRPAQSMKWVSPSHRSAGVRTPSEPPPSTLSRTVTVRMQNYCVFLLYLLFLKCFFPPWIKASSSHLSLPQTFVLQSFWPASSVTRWTVCWPPSEGAAGAPGRCARRCARPCAAASPPPCSPSWTSPAAATSAGVWVLAASCATVPSATSAFRRQSAWTSLWKSLKCFITNAGCQQITTSRHESMGNLLFVKIFQKPTCRDKTQMLPAYG